MAVRLRMLRGNLRMTDGSSVTDLSITSSTYYIGAGGDCNLRCSDSSISARHCVVMSDGSQVAVHDLNSETGTYVNDAKVVGRQIVKAGDLLRVGGLEFEVLIGDDSVVSDNSRWRGVNADQPAKDDKELDGDITEMLERADEYDRESRLANPESLRFDVSQLGSPATAEPEETEAEAEPAAKRRKKSKPTKLPAAKMPAKGPDIKAENSKEAAADMLGKLFKGRPKA